MNLYYLDTDIRHALSMTDEDGVITDEGYEWLMQLNLEREQLLEALLIDVKESQAQAEAIKAEERSLRDRRSQLERRAERTKAMLADYADGEKISTGRASLTWRKSTAVVIDDEDKIPAEFRTQIVTESIDKRAIKEALGEDNVPGARLEVRSNPQVK